MARTITSREFNRDVSAAKRAAEQGPVTITDHGRRSHVLLSAAEYDRIVAGTERAGLRLRMHGHEDLDLQLPDRTPTSLRVPDL